MSEPEPKNSIQNFKPGPLPFNPAEFAREFRIQRELENKCKAGPAPQKRLKPVAQQISILKMVLAPRWSGDVNEEMQTGVLPEGAEGWCASSHFITTDIPDYASAVHAVFKVIEMYFLGDIHEGGLSDRPFGRQRYLERTMPAERHVCVLNRRQKNKGFIVFPIKFEETESLSPVSALERVSKRGELAFGIFEAGLFMLTHFGIVHPFLRHNYLLCADTVIEPVNEKTYRHYTAFRLDPMGKLEFVTIPFDECHKFFIPTMMVV